MRRSCRQWFYVDRNAFDALVGGDSSASTLRAEAESSSSLVFSLLLFLRSRPGAFPLLSESFIVCVFRGSFHLIERLKEDTQERNIDFSILSRRNAV